MKTIGSPTSFLILSILVISACVISFYGCNNTVTNSINTNIYQARSEQDFVANGDLRARQGAVIAVHLEDLNSTPTDSIPDTGTIGEDIIPFRYTENALHTIRMESTARYYAYLQNEVTGDWVYFISPEQNYVTVNIPAGDYKLHLNSGVDYQYDSLVGRQVIFIQPEGDPLHTVFSVGGCPNCDLSLANLKHMSFPLMNFRGANLNKADLGHTNLIGTNLSYSNLNGTYFYQAIMPYADLSYSSAQGIILRSTDLRNANVGASDLTYGDLRFADIRAANFCGSTLTGIISNGIIYDGNTQCWP